MVKLQAELKEIDARRVDGNFVDENGNVARGSDAVATLLKRCLEWTEIVLDRYLPLIIAIWLNASSCN